MQNRFRNSLTRTPKITPNPIDAPPKGALYIGMVNGKHVYLMPRDRSFHLLIIGASGCGKTVSMEGLARQDITAGRGLCLIDPMGALSDRLQDYCCYRKAVGCRIPEIIFFNASDGDDWILPFNPFVRGSGELSVQVDRRVSATLRAWGQHSGDETPRLEKWLKCLYTALIECNLTVLEAGILLDQHAGELRSLLLRGLNDGIVRTKLEQLSRYKPSEFLEQTESVENRLMRFLCSDHLRRIFGVGTSALDFRSIMDEAKILLVNLKPSQFLSREQQRLIGTLLLNEFFETALTRPSGSRPFYCYVDEAASFVTPELGEALETCRQKGLHFTLAFQHLAQFKEQGERVYKAVKINVRNKMIFSIPDRQDALELADDVFVGLAEPQLKFMHRRLNHEIIDTRLQSTTRSQGTNSSRGETASSTLTYGRSRGSSTGVSDTASHAVQSGSGKTRTFSRGTSESTSEGQSDTYTHNESHGSAYSENRGRNSNTASNSSETVLQAQNSSLFSQQPQNKSTTAGQSRSESESYSRSESGHDDYSDGESHTHTSNTSTSSNTSLSWAKSKQRSTTDGTSHTVSAGQNRSSSRSYGRSQGQTDTTGTNESVSTTDQPGVLHRAFLEEDPEHWSLEEQRWRAAELIMHQRVGHWFLRTSSQWGFGSSELPGPFYTLPKQMLRLTREFYQRHCLSTSEADHRVTSRQQKLLQGVAPAQTINITTTPEEDEAEPAAPQPVKGPVWTRTNQKPKQ